MDIKKSKEKIIDFIKKQTGEKPVVIGISGGIDSAAVVYLAVKALGKDNVYGLILPSKTNSKDDVRLAKEVVKILNIKYLKLNIDNIIDSYKKTAEIFNNQKILGNLKARVRMCLLYGKANEINGLVLGTGNKSELMVGYFTKYGDGGVDVLPIGDLYKTDVIKLAKYLKVPPEIINRQPTAGLWKGQTDEGELGITYNNLDKILLAIEKKQSLAGFKKSEVELVKQYIGKSAHKRRMPL